VFDAAVACGVRMPGSAVSFSLKRKRPAEAGFSQFVYLTISRKVALEPVPDF
jgi:hypothetical protein